MKENKSAFLIAAPKSHSGKTMFTLGMMRALVRRGLQVQAFKCGPDYIDPMHHSKVAQGPSYNLDLWMASEAHVKQVFQAQSATCDVAIAEGVMGLFDGARKDEGSSAAVARLLNLPVVLVVDASSVAYSVAPLLFGYKHFDSRINLAGVVFNKVASAGHYQFLKEAAEDAGVSSLGYLPRDERLAISSRHLGLHLPGETQNMAIVDCAADLIEAHVDVEALLAAAKQEDRAAIKKEKTTSTKEIRVALAHDAAFNFSYRANRDCLEALGEVLEFSPLSDAEMPSADLLWLPGGYPELFAEELSQNTPMHRSVLAHIRAGKAVIAECGGMMYLAKALITKEGRVHPMVGALDFKCSFEKMKLHLGYRAVEGENGVLRGHEFHYSEMVELQELQGNYRVQTARGKTLDMPIFRKQNCWASYLHLYLGEMEKMKMLLKELGLCLD